ncbi:MAG TPA: hypothetical protein VJ969_08545 [Desulfopila sp.]|nr:hypothetical protein [Desulfopila sp.]
MDGDLARLNQLERIASPLALTRAGAAKNTAKSFYDDMGSPVALEVLTHFGFEAIP